MLPALLTEYNATKHRTIGIAPERVRSKFQLAHVYDNVKLLDPRHERFRVGDVVRISKYKRVFEKGYEPSWTTELSTVSRISETIAGRFYPEEMQRTGFPNHYLFEKVYGKGTPPFSALAGHLSSERQLDRH